MVQGLWGFPFYGLHGALGTGVQGMPCLWALGRHLVRAYSGCFVYGLQGAFGTGLLGVLCVLTSGAFGTGLLGVPFL